MSEILFGLVAAVFVAAVLGLAAYRAGQASGREQHRAEAHKVWEARNRGDNRPAREILGKEPENVIAWRARPDPAPFLGPALGRARDEMLARHRVELEAQRIRHAAEDEAEERRRAALERIDRHDRVRK